MSQSNCTIYVVDDDPSIRKSLKRLLSSADYSVVLFSDADEFWSANITDKESACLILDVKMPGMTGYDLQEKLNSVNSILPIIFITGYGDIPSSVKAIKNGAINFLPKPFNDAELFISIEEALKKSAELITDQKEKNYIRERVNKLTNREYEILTYVLSGRLNKNIAAELNISEKTVKVHRGRIMGKLDVDSVAALVSLTNRIGIKPAEILKD